jgi:hypothetical protein
LSLGIDVWSHLILPRLPPRRNVVPMRSLSAALLVLALAAPFSRAATQAPAPLAHPDAIPFDLASVLLSTSSFAGEPQVLVGAAPGWILPRLYIPDGARVFGSAFLGQSVVTVIALPTNADTSTADISAALVQRGWHTPPPPPARMNVGGFRPAPMPQSVSRVMLCGERDLMNTYTRRHAGSVVYLIEHVSPSGTVGPCHPPEPPRSFSVIASPFPTLIDPPGSDSRGCSLTPISGSSGIGTALRADMAPQALLDYFGQQLADSGWTAVDATMPTVARSFTRRDSAIPRGRGAR